MVRGKALAVRGWQRGLSVAERGRLDSRGFAFQGARSIARLVVFAATALMLQMTAGGDPQQPSSLRTVVIALQLVDRDVADGAWIGVFGGASGFGTDGRDAHRWTWIDSGGGAVRVPIDEVRLVGVAKGVVPIAATLPSGTDDELVTFRFVEGLRRTVSIIDRETVPVRGARLSIDLSDDDLVVPDFVLPAWTSDHHGEIQLAGLEPTTYRVDVSAPGYLPIHGLGIDISDTAVAPVLVTLREPHFIVGRVVDSDNAPVPFADVHSVRTRRATGSGPVHLFSENHVLSGTTDADGRFTIGPFVLADQVDLSVHTVDGGLAMRSLAVSPGLSVTIMVTEGGVGTSGLVVAAATGLPVDDFTLVATSPAGKAARRFESANGEFRTVLPTRVSNLTISAPGHLPWTKRLSFPTSGVHHDFGRIEIESYLRLRGQVVARHDQSPIRGARVAAVLGRGYRTTAVSDTHGRFSLDGVPERGRVFLHVKASGYADEILSVGVESAILIQLGGGGQVVGRVTTPDGRPVLTGEATVRSLDRGLRFVALLDGRIDSGDDYLMRTAVLDEQGGFQFSGVPVGDYTASVRTEAGEAEPVEFKIGHDDEHVPLSLTVHPLGAVLGTITGLNTNETASLAIWTLSPIGAQRKHLKSVSGLGNGNYHVAGIPDGRSLAVLKTSRRRWLEVPFDIFDSNDAEVGFDFLGEATLRGRVTLAGEPVRVTVVAEGARSGKDSGVRAEARTTAEGYYTIAGLPNGRYRLDFMAWDGLGGLALVVDASGETVTDIELPTLSVAGRVFGLSPDRNGVVRAIRDSDGHERHAIVDTQGTYRFDRMPAGGYTFAVLSQRHWGTVRSVQVNDRIESFDFHLTPAETVPILVIDHATRKRPSSFVRVACNDGPLHGTTERVLLDPDGQATLPSTLVGRALRITDEQGRSSTLTWNGRPVEVIVDSRQGNRI